MVSRYAARRHLRIGEIRAAADRDPVARTTGLARLRQPHCRQMASGPLQEEVHASPEGLQIALRILVNALNTQHSFDIYIYNKNDHNKYAMNDEKTNRTGHQDYYDHTAVQGVTATNKILNNCK